MPPKLKITKNDIVRAAVALVRESGEGALNARGVAGALGCSTQPIFSNFSTMEQLREAVTQAAEELYQSYLRTDMASGNYPPYKASGMAYIRFAREERELFKLLFMRDRSQEPVTDNISSIQPLLTLIRRNLGISEEEALLFHTEMWIYVHGIATMIATSYLNWDEEMVSRMITDAYTGMKYRYLGGNSHAGNSN